MKVVSVLSTVASLLIAPTMSHAQSTQPTGWKDKIGSLWSDSKPVATCAFVTVIQGEEEAEKPKKTPFLLDTNLKVSDSSAQVGNVIRVFENSGLKRQLKLSTPYYAEVHTFNSATKTPDDKPRPAEVRDYPIRDLTRIVAGVTQNPASWVTGINKGEALLAQAAIKMLAQQGNAGINPLEVRTVRAYYLNDVAIAVMNTPGALGLDKVAVLVEAKDEKGETLGLFVGGSVLLPCGLE